MDRPQSSPTAGLVVSGVWCDLAYEDLPKTKLKFVCIVLYCRCRTFYFCMPKPSKIKHFRTISVFSSDSSKPCCGVHTWALVKACRGHYIVNAGRSVQSSLECLGYRDNAYITRPYIYILVFQRRHGLNVQSFWLFQLFPFFLMDRHIMGLGHSCCFLRWSSPCGWYETRIGSKAKTRSCGVVCRMSGTVGRL